tara:strand:- start:191 stop:481 length:291 start_codon:yes stop_codon:yes gene_type:complete
MFISQIFIPKSGLLTVTNVKVTDDLKIAKIYFSFLNNKISVYELLKILKNKKKLIRYYIGQEIKLKYIPELRFYYDDTTEQAEKINILINQTHQDD